MDVIWTSEGTFCRAPYASEKDLEAAILEVHAELFGTDRLYLDVKKLIGVPGKKQNIPDGYLIDLTGKKPRLFVVENELAAHEPLRHVAVQILEFSLSFEDAPLTVRNTLLGAIEARAEIKERCEQYASAHEFTGLFEMVDWLVHDHKSPFAALVVIDEMPESLERVLRARFQFGVEILELARYENGHGKRFYRFEPFLGQADAGPQPVPTDQLDTVVFGGLPSSVEQMLLKEHRWYPVKIGGAMQPQLKYMAVYEASPTSAVRYVAPIHSIETWQDSDKLVVEVGEPIEQIGPVCLVKGGRIPSGVTAPRYTSYHRLKAAKTLEDVW